MTVNPVSPASTDPHAGSGRFRLNRAGILNVWQYDEQVFDLAEGRLLLRGANGAGKSKTLEMLLPFALDGDKARITASAKHHTSLLWLMTDGYEGQARIGYVWVEFQRHTPKGETETFTCGVGIRASTSARSATAWHFATTRRVGHDLVLEDAAGPLPRGRLVEALGTEGQVFEKASAYKEHVGRALFGLAPSQFDEVLRLLYWLRQPQIGEEIEPAKLAAQLSQALPQLDERAVRSAGDTFDELTAFGEQIDRRAAAAEALVGLADAYAGYARAVVAERARAMVEALRVERRARAEVRRTEVAIAELGSDTERAEAQRAAARTGVSADDARLRELEASPESRSQRTLTDLAERVALDERNEASARTRVARHEEVASRAAQREQARAGAAVRGVAAQRERVRGLDLRQRDAVPGSGVPVPAVLDTVDPDRVDRVPSLVAGLDRVAEAVRRARADVGRRMAGVGLVREALTRADQAVTAAQSAEREAGRAEQRWEGSRQARLRADHDAETERSTLWGQLVAWAGEPGAPALELPEELTEESVPSLAWRANEAAAPGLRELGADRALAQAGHEAARAEIEKLTVERASVDAQRDPAPPPPVLARTVRDDGQPFWRVVDFQPGVDEGDRAGLEAALQSAGLLDAWIRPGGVLLGVEHLDVVLTGSPESADVARPGSLAGALVPDLAPDADLTPGDVGRVLAAIGLGRDDARQAWVDSDGSWRLGPAHGRALKATAQYIGATARAQERARRLAVLDTALAEQRALLQRAADLILLLESAIADLHAWVSAVPSGQALLRAWTVADERRGAEQRDEQENRVAQGNAHAARTASSQARSALEAVAAEQDLPVERGRLDRLDQQLRSLDADLADVVGQGSGLSTALTLWEEAAAERTQSDERLAAELGDLAEAELTRTTSMARLLALRESVGDSVRELEARIADVRASRRSHESAATAADARAGELLQRLGGAQADARNAADRLAEQVARRAMAVAGTVGVSGVPGMLEAAGVPADDASLIEGLGGHPADEPVGRTVLAACERLAALSQVEAIGAGTRVWRAHGEAASGPAADHQPTVSEFGELLAVSGRDDAGEASIVTLAQRVVAAVDRDRDLLTTRERAQFEQHILGELGDTIRACRRDAEELVTAMNTQLAKVTTSQGIRVKLDWKMRDDVPAEARAAVGLLAQPVGALIPEERTELRDALHRLIEASRVEHPELAYGEHLGAALDYRTWSEFTIRYTRPESPGRWDRLHRRSALSQGEQKVLCYLPLFAAAAAHFTSLAGAAPYAPRLVLLDDAFPKIDVRTHPLLFGLLVQLDLDFVITSERLWGDHATVPSLAIYEALRDPSQRGIAQYEYRWDGRALQALG